MTSIAAIAGFHPAQRVSISDYLCRHGVDEAEIKVYERFYGFSEIRIAEGMGLADQMLVSAARLADLPRLRHRIRYVIQARTMPIASPYPTNPLHTVRSGLGLEHATAFCLNQQACASGLLAVEVAGRLLERDGDPQALALIFVGEKMFTSSAQVLSFTAVMGESTAAVLVAPGEGPDTVLSYASRIYGRYYLGPRMPAELNNQFADGYADALAEVIRAAVDGAGLTIDDIALILPHHVNRMSWVRVLRRLGLRGRDRLFLDNLASTGHCFAADPFLNRETAQQQGRLRNGDYYVMTSVGLGATFSAMVLAC
ncbi:3-oxoacyl-[acyl-carrier-protein] synthase III C-terminal domain-containing protein [Micromonospora sp. CPCC 205539]|uniref:3-oxoacyl-[acyl-carrier-protein] synthase III C-terminal domain-containing protein n=1 Tax=Micromonospora sp. CPCC 205539 TaxID=3122408 RepID=UPI002FF29809